MNLRAASICAAMTVLGWSGSVAIGQVAATGVSNVLDDDLPPVAREVLKEFESETQKIRGQADKQISVQRDSAIKLLDELQNKLNREQKTDEAIAIREKIRQLRISHLKSRPNPGNLTRFSNKFGQTFYFDVTGAANGAVWGTDVYTSDSSLAAAAVHAGVLKIGQRGLVRVTIVKSPERHEGSEKNDVRTSDYGPYLASYKVRRPLASDTNTDESASEPDAGFLEVPRTRIRLR